MAQITYYAPAGVTSINLSDGSRAVVVDGQITVDSKFRNELEAAGCSANAETDNAVRFTKTLTGVIKNSTAGGRAIPRNSFPTRSNLGTRVLCGRVVNNAVNLGSTFHVMMRLAAEFDAVRLILANPTVADVVGVKAAFCAGGSTASPLNSAGSWTNATFSGGATVTLPLSADANNPTITLSDWMPLTGDSSKLLSVRVYIPSAGNTTCPVVSGGTISGWQTKDGEEWFSRYHIGDFIATPASFTDNTAATVNAIVGVQYLARGEVVTVMGIGDSVMQGVGAKVPCDSYWVKAVREIRASGTAVEVCNLGWSGQTTTQVYNRAVVAIPLLTPNVVVYGAFSPNDGAPSAASDKAMRFNWLRARDLIFKNGAVCLAVNGLPRAASASSSNWTAQQDDIRKAYNEQTVNNQSYVADIATSLSNSEAYGAASWYGPSLTDDWIHPNEAGNVQAGGVVKPVLLSLV